MKRFILLACIIFMNLSLISCSDLSGYSDEALKELAILKEEKLEDLATEYNMSIIDEISLENSKIVGFSNDTIRGVLVYEKDVDGNYTINQINKLDIDKNDLGVSHFRVIYENYNDIKNAKYGYVIVSNGKKASRVEITINDIHKYYANLKIGEESIILIEENLPTNETDVIRLEVKYFDKNNNELLQ